MYMLTNFKICCVFQENHNMFIQIYPSEVNKKYCTSNGITINLSFYKLTKKTVIIKTCIKWSKCDKWTYNDENIVNQDSLHCYSWCKKYWNIRIKYLDTEQRLSGLLVYYKLNKFENTNFSMKFPEFFLDCIVYKMKTVLFYVFPKTTPIA